VGAGQSLRQKKALEGGVHVKAYVRYVIGPMYFSLDLLNPLTKLGRGYPAQETRPAVARGNRSRIRGTREL